MGDRIGSRRVAEAALTASLVCAGLSVMSLLAALFMLSSTWTGPGLNRLLAVAVSLATLAVFSLGGSAVLRARMGEPVFRRRPHAREVVRSLARAVTGALLSLVAVILAITLFGAFVMWLVSWSS